MLCLVDVGTLLGKNNLVKIERGKYGVTKKVKALKHSIHLFLVVFDLKTTKRTNLRFL
jgi:hypothetical protein